MLKKSKVRQKFGAGQGIGWINQAYNATLNVISNVMESSCKGMKFSSPNNRLIVETFGDYFVDDTELGTNEKGKSKSMTLMEQA